MATISSSAPRPQRAIALQLVERHGTLRLADLRAHGIAATTLSRLVDEGLLVRPARGLYELAGAEVSSSHSLAELAAKVPAGVICLLSAAQLHEITLQNPASIWMAIGPKAHKPRIRHVRVRFVHFGDRALGDGVETIRIDGVPVRAFGVAKTVVDCFRYRRLVGLDVALEALRIALRERKATPAAIAEVARRQRIWSVMRPYLESLAADDA